MVCTIGPSASRSSANAARGNGAPKPGGGPPGIGTGPPVDADVSPAMLVPGWVVLPEPGDPKAPPPVSMLAARTSWPLRMGDADRIWSSSRSYCERA
jgi:hypothetical protein